ncbi:type II secretion system F family protein [Anatilimnocola floriformis]|uniref:type II secretion system F family protein n=1 Tax=Anatilimnocola floriformis TaxID=2948575 RepID=UPI0020C50674|nr:type II secretion system F family protein [Anatilimnocola floriformis]
MATANLSPRQTLSLEQLIALSDEIAALARTGMPLDQGLSALGHELPGRLGRVSREMGSELAAGMSLDQVVARSGTQFPPGYQALVEAGLRAGNLPGILQGMMQLARKTGELRRQMLLAAINPLLVVCVTWILFLFWLNKLAGVYLMVAADWDIDVSLPQAVLRSLRQTQWLWEWLVPAAFLALIVWSWRRSSRGLGEWSLLDLPTLGVVRGLGLMRRAGQSAVLCDQLAILLEHGLPLTEALRLAGGTLTSQPLARATLEFANQLERGQMARPPQPFPPLVACLLLDAPSGQHLSTNLRQLAANYHAEVRRRGLWLATWVPSIFTLAIGGSLALFHLLITLGPWLVIMRKMVEV